MRTDELSVIYLFELRYYVKHIYCNTFSQNVPVSNASLHQYNINQTDILLYRSRSLLSANSHSSAHFRLLDWRVRTAEETMEYYKLEHELHTGVNSSDVGNVNNATSSSSSSSHPPLASQITLEQFLQAWNRTQGEQRTEKSSCKTMMRRHMASIISICSMLLNVILIVALIPGLRSDINIMKGQTETIQTVLAGLTGVLVNVSDTVYGVNTEITQFNADLNRTKQDISTLEQDVADRLAQLNVTLTKAFNETNYVQAELDIASVQLNYTLAQVQSTILLINQTGQNVLQEIVSMNVSAQIPLLWQNVSALYNNVTAVNSTAQVLSTELHSKLRVESVF